MILVQVLSLKDNGPQVQYHRSGRLRHIPTMDKTYLPNDQYLTVSLRELELAWRMMASPDKFNQIQDALQTVQAIHRNEGPEKAIFTIVAATAWLTDDKPGPSGWKT
jgi:hypothetical protein